MSAYDKTAVEHVVLDGLKSYIEDTIEYSDTILDIHNDIFDTKKNIESNPDNVYDYAYDLVDEAKRDFEREVESLQNEIAELKQMIEEKS